MKNIKRLTNEKALLAKAFRENKENSASLKKDLDGNISRYQQLQKSYDDLAVELGEDEEHVCADSLQIYFVILFKYVHLATTEGGSRTAGEGR